MVMCDIISHDGDSAGLQNIVFWPFFDVGDDLRSF
jgi:hypothetical protein